jgi:hypothetical protein
MQNRPLIDAMNLSERYFASEGSNPSLSASSQ